jgi:predicted ATPase/DNA-binding SARP family transcriptional activator
MKVGVLGPLTVMVPSGAVTIGAPKPRALLTLLALRAGHPVPTAVAIDALWGDDPPRTARKTMQTYVTMLRRVLPTGSVQTDPGGYRLVLDADRVDALRFEHLVGVGSRSLREHSHLAAIASLTDGLALWRGPAAEDLADQAFGRSAARRLNEMALGAQEDLADAELALGHHDQLVADLGQAVDREPLRERRWAQLMVALYRCGRQADALRTYQRLRTLLVETLGLQPGPDLIALEQAILLGDLPAGPSPLVPGRPDAAELPGGRGSEDTRPASGPPPTAMAPGVRTDSEVVSGPTWPEVTTTNLPGSVTSFIGRDVDLDDLHGLVNRFPLVTLTGSGGVGKSRLAVELARRTRGDWDQGPWFVDLAAVSTDAAVARTVGDVLGLRQDLTGDPVEHLTRWLGRQSLLVVLDNCEHLLAPCARLAEVLGRACPGVRLLVTSREPLGATGERVVAVEPLAVPDDSPARFAELMGYSAIELFVDRAQAQRRDFHLDRSNAGVVAAICRRLDGLPLAIELAAARVRSLPLADIERRLDHRFDLLNGPRRDGPLRQQTLRATVEWSYTLLDQRERSTLQRLSVFRSGWDLEQASVVAAGGGVGDGGTATADLISSLVDKSLVQVDPGVGGNIRYRLLETVVQFLDDCTSFRTSGDWHEARDAHAQAYVGLARRARPELIGPRQGAWFERLDTEHRNMRAAIGHLIVSGAGNDALEACLAVKHWWYVRGFYREALETLDAALTAAGSSAPPAVRAAAQASSGMMLVSMGGWAKAQARYAEALSLARAADVPLVVVEALCGLSRVAQMTVPDDEKACRLAEEALGLARQHHDPDLLGRTLERVGSARSMRLWRKEQASRRRGPAAEREAAESAFREALACFASSGNRQMRAQTAQNWATFELATSQFEAARRHLEEAQRTAAEIRDEGLMPFVLNSLGWEARLRGEIGQAWHLFIQSLRSCRRNADRSGYAARMADLALCASLLGDLDVACRLHGAAKAEWEAIGEWRYSDIEHEVDLLALRTTLGEDRFARLFAEGEAQGGRAADDLISDLAVAG